ncbi:hypothetical protein R6Q59_013487 [Mikania micrantha]
MPPFHYRSWQEVPGSKNKAQKHFDKVGGYDNTERAKTKPPEGMDPDAWVRVIEELFKTPTYQKRSQANSANRSKQLYGSYHGTQSYAQRRYTEVQETGVAKDVEDWREMHYKGSSGWYNELAETHWVAKYWGAQAVGAAPSPGLFRLKRNTQADLDLLGASKSGSPRVRSADPHNINTSNNSSFLYLILLACFRVKSWTRRTNLCQARVAMIRQLMRLKFLKGRWDIGVVTFEVLDEQ